MPYCTLLPNFLQGELRITHFSEDFEVRVEGSNLFIYCLSDVCALFAITVFVCRYGETHPMFFIGSLEAASQEAFYGKARDVSKTSDC